ncbi:hypothetical protein O0L34_g1825 [Tuta absoluta]|nr:hypothetical protein O0L34_g1825 [Tuta absoluta]
MDPWDYFGAGRWGGYGWGGWMDGGNNEANTVRRIMNMFRFWDRDVAMLELTAEAMASEARSRPNRNYRPNSPTPNRSDWDGPNEQASEPEQEKTQTPEEEERLCPEERKRQMAEERLRQDEERRARTKAAEAALARLRKDKITTSAPVQIKVRIKKELEKERAQASTSAPKDDQPPSTSASNATENTEDYETDSENFAAAGVYFRCPLFGDDVMPREEWKNEIKSILCERFRINCENSNIEVRGLTAALIIQSCNSDTQKVIACKGILRKYLENIISYPDEVKYQKIRMSNKAFQENVLPITGAMEFLQAAGFEKKMIATAAADEEYLVFNSTNVPSIESLTTLIYSLTTVEPIPLELDRNKRVMLPSQAVQKTALPAEFYAVPPAEVARQRLLNKNVDKSFMLQTQAMRDKEELRGLQIYKYAIIRIRFPDGILLQGTFSVYETYSDIHKFVRENLHSQFRELAFFLRASGSDRKIVLEEDASKTLLELRLVPTTVLNFNWHASALEQVNNSPDKDVYLKPEVMNLLEENY